jgi:hypothetical protein
VLEQILSIGTIFRRKNYYDVPLILSTRPNGLKLNVLLLLEYSRRSKFNCTTTRHVYTRVPTKFSTASGQTRYFISLHLSLDLVLEYHGVPYRGGGYGTTIKYSRFTRVRQTILKLVWGLLCVETRQAKALFWDGYIPVFNRSWKNPGVTVRSSKKLQCCPTSASYK